MRDDGVIKTHLKQKIKFVILMDARSLYRYTSDDNESWLINPSWKIDVWKRIWQGRIAR